MGIWLEVDQPEALGHEEADGDEEEWRRDGCRSRRNNPPCKYRRQDQRQRGNIHAVISYLFACRRLVRLRYEAVGITA